MSDEFVLDRDAALRVSKAVRRVEKLGGKLSDMPGLSGMPTPRIALVKWTGGSSNAAGFLPGLQVAANVPQPPMNLPVNPSVGQPPPGLPAAATVLPPGAALTAPIPGSNQFSNAGQPGLPPNDCWLQTYSNPAVAIPQALLAGKWYLGLCFSSYTDGLPVFYVSESLAFLQVTGTSPESVYIGRTIADAVITKGGTLITSPTANFTSADSGWIVSSLFPPDSNGNLPTLAYVNSTTMQVSEAAIGGASPATVTLATRIVEAYPAQVATWNQGSGSNWTATASQAWFWTPDTVGPDASPVYQLASTLNPLSCAVLGADASGVPICGFPNDPGTYYTASNPYMPDGGGISGANPLAVYGPAPYPDNGQGAFLTIGSTFLLFGFVLPSGVACGGDIWVAPGATAASQGVAPQAYQGDTGQDGVGNQFVNGLNVSIGGGGGGGVVDGGSDW